MRDIPDADRGRLTSVNTRWGNYLRKFGSNLINSLKIHKKGILQSQIFQTIALTTVRKRIKSALDESSIHDVHLSRLRFSDQEAYVKEGFGGKDVTAWPVYAFYQSYMEGQREAAHAAYCNWYMEQLKKYHTTSKEKGGMNWGSLYQLIAQKYAEKQIDYGDDIFFDRVVVTLGTQERVDQRFAFLESIIQKGYDPKLASHSMGIQKKGYIYIINGHHRWAALKLLGYDYLPEVLVFRNNIRKIKKTIQRIRLKWKPRIGRK